MMKMLFVVCIISMLAATGAAAQDGGSGGIEIELDGQPLALAEMEEATGGLPRGCRDLDYDPIEDKCLNNKGQEYEKGTNDCDIWVEKVLGQAGIEISSKWGAAFSTDVKGHVQILSGQLLKEAPLGWSIEIIDEGHVALVRVNTDGSADLYHQGLNRRTSTTEKWEGSRGYHYENASSACWGDSSRFWGFDR
jgi:hypothetical protein